MNETMNSLVSHPAFALGVVVGMLLMFVFFLAYDR